jgi:hypothetical protein
MNMQVLDARGDLGAGYKVDVSRGGRIGRVSSEWFERPEDERFLSLDALARMVRGRAERTRTRVVESALSHFEASGTDSERLSLMLPGAEAPVAPTHWSFGYLATLVGAPSANLRQLPAAPARINLQYRLTSHRAEQIKTMEIEGDRVELRAVTGPDSGRIFDHELVEAVQRIAGNGTGDTRWKVPGGLDWSTGTYNPRVDITRDTTTLYASDRDVFLFLVDDLNPIEVGKLADGSPDLYFRGFYCWNSEVGAKTLGMASFYLGAVCQNRNLWGVEDFGGDHHPAFQARRLPLRPRGATGAHELRQLLACAVSQRHPDPPRARRREERRGSHRLSAQARLLPCRERADHRHGAGRGRQAAGDDLRLRAGHHRGRPAPSPIRTKSLQLQVEAENWWIGKIKGHITDKGLDRYEGQMIDGVYVIHNGMINAAHLAGPDNLSKWLESGGKFNPDDGHTSIRDYMLLGTKQELGSAGAVPTEPGEELAEDDMVMPLPDGYVVMDEDGAVGRQTAHGPVPVTQAELDAARLNWLGAVKEAVDNIMGGFVSLVGWLPEGIRPDEWIAWQMADIAEREKAIKASNPDAVTAGDVATLLARWLSVPASWGRPGSPSLRSSSGALLRPRRRRPRPTECSASSTTRRISSTGSMPRRWLRLRLGSRVVE